MGNSAQQHRAAISTFPARLTSKSWSSGSTSMKKKRLMEIKEDMTNLIGNARDLWRNLQVKMTNKLKNPVILFVMTMLLLLNLMNIMNCDVTMIPTQGQMGTMTYKLGEVEPMDGGGVVSHLVTMFLLLTSGDIETNPGPVCADSLTRGLATLITQASSVTIKTALTCWSSSKNQTEICTALEQPFKVDQLKEILAWLLDISVKDKQINNKKKGVLSISVVIAIESLLPDNCTVCNEEYTIPREERPALRCKGCSQGFHQLCRVTLALCCVVGS